VWRRGATLSITEAFETTSTASLSGSEIVEECARGPGLRPATHRLDDFLECRVVLEHRALSCQLGQYQLL